MTATSTSRSPDRRPLLLLEAATLASGMGNSIALVALPWLVLELTGRATDAGIVATATALPLFASSLFSGTVVDLLGRRATAVVSDLASGMAIAAIPLLALGSDLSVGVVAALAALGAVFDPAGVTARESLLPEAAAAAGVRLERANGVHEAVWAVAFLAGPGLGGLLIAVVGATTTLWATSAGFALAVALVAAIRVEGSDRPAAAERPTGLLSGTLEGLRFVWGDRLLRVIGLLTMAMVAIYLPVEGVLLPTFFEQQDAPGRLGAVLMAMSGGAVVSTLAYGQWAARVGRRTLWLAGTMGTAAALLVMATLPPLPVMLVAAVLVGVCYGPIQPLVNLAMQTTTPPRLRGRVIGVLVAAEYAAGPAGFVVAGPAADAVGVRPTFLALAGLLVVVTVAAVGVPALRRLDALPSTPPAEEEPGPVPADVTARSRGSRRRWRRSRRA